MTILISASEIQKSYGSRPLFERLTFVVSQGERVGLIGPNGSGKSTLLNILTGKTNVDHGDLTFRRGLRVGFLEQTPILPLDLSVEAVVSETVSDPHDGTALARVGELMSKLDLNPFAKTPLRTLSGGWRKRVALARELVKAPELLLLDEPTNHLDIESIVWLETFLTKQGCATVTVTHDRLFLQRVSERILELDKRNPGGLLNVQGDYATYLERKEALLSAQRQEELSLKNKLRRETEWLRRGPKARTTKQQARIQAAGELLQSVEELEARNQQRAARIDFQTSVKTPKRLIEAKAISKAFGERVLFRNLNLFIGPGSRIGLLGGNGCGKSTLIRILLGQEEADSGVTLRSEKLKAAYFEQNRDTLEPNVTLRKTLCPDGDHVNFLGRMIHIHGYLDRFLFRKEQIDLPVGRLSGGEQSRVLIARLMLNEANLLVLDEPTNDLDIETLDVLEECLDEFEGAVLLVTHDRYFLDQVASQIHAFPRIGDYSGSVVTFAGLAQWEDWIREREQKPRGGDPASARIAPAARKRKLSFNEARELSQMESKIQETEAQLSRLNEEAGSAANQSNAMKLTEIYESIAQTQAALDGLYARWAELEELAKQN